jgi:DNA-binding winged helix-turn-helix (wHTH) protein
MKAVWPDAFVFEDSLTQSVSVLRRALGDDPAHPRFIVTVARRGYRFVAPDHRDPTELSARTFRTFPHELSSRRRTRPSSSRS